MATISLWQVLLVYLEVLLIAQYTFQIPTRLQCSIITIDLRASAEALGLHGDAFRCLPLFILYLATLMHTYSLARWQVLYSFERYSRHASTHAPMHTRMHLC